MTTVIPKQTSKQALVQRNSHESLNHIYIYNFNVYRSLMIHFTFIFTQMISTIAFLK
jgi:hypothetical protein